jgi:hypothetical protein
MAAFAVSFRIAAAIAIALAATQPSCAEVLHGDQFITAMDGNTVSGVTNAGMAYNLYFLPGGEATYVDVYGKRLAGSWRLDKAGHVCFAWAGAAPIPAGCYEARLDDQHLVLSNGSLLIDEEVRGAVADTFRKR